jgi:hypothetical protein
MGAMEVIDPAIGAYVAALDQRLIGPARARRSLVDEALDHLVDASQALQRAGWAPERAAAQALADFGSVRQVAGGYQHHLSLAAARRAALTLLAVLVPQGFLWDNGLRLAPTSDSSAGQWLHPGMEWFGFAALLGAGAVVVVAGLGQRWWAPGPALARWTAILVATAALGTGGLGVALMALSGATSPAHWGLVAVLLVAPMALAARSAERCRRAAATPFVAAARR